MSHVAHVVNRLNGEDMCLVGSKVGVGLDGSRHLLELCPVFQLYIHHAAVDALSQGNGHRQGIPDTLLGAHADAVSHRHAWSEVGV